MATAYSVASGSMETVTDEDLVFVVSSRDGTYKHDAHRVSRVENGIPVTYCRVYARGGLVKAEMTDAITWCRWGCRTRQMLMSPERQ